MSAIGFTREKCDTLAVKGLIIDIGGEESRTTNSRQPARNLKNTELSLFPSGRREGVYTWEEKKMEEVGS